MFWNDNNDDDNMAPSLTIHVKTMALNIKKWLKKQDFNYEFNLETILSAEYHTSKCGDRKLVFIYFLFIQLYHFYIHKAKQTRHRIPIYNNPTNFDIENPE